ncbi:hypothetical protein SAMN05216439_1489 [Methanobrevibacter gottschalkii]|uniref:Uncharacterized protein n=1 Tax=Methanobrevibacter gottschalkii TaxID=190974 RepID=A0A1H7JZH7_9EURY|nr:hypothetical protein SAMN05216439_1489 [Methanobrevibacter gottschalkii]
MSVVIYIKRLSKNTIFSKLGLKFYDKMRKKEWVDRNPSI